MILLSCHFDLQQRCLQTLATAVRQKTFLIFKYRHWLVRSKQVKTTNQLGAALRTLEPDGTAYLQLQLTQQQTLLLTQGTTSLHAFFSLKIQKQQSSFFSLQVQKQQSSFFSLQVQKQLTFQTYFFSLKIQKQQTFQTSFFSLIQKQQTSCHSKHSNNGHPSFNLKEQQQKTPSSHSRNSKSRHLLLTQGTATSRHLLLIQVTATVDTFC